MATDEWVIMHGLEQPGLDEKDHADIIENNDRAHIMLEASRLYNSISETMKRVPDKDQGAGGAYRVRLMKIKKPVLKNHTPLGCPHPLAPDPAVRVKHIWDHGRTK